MRLFCLILAALATAAASAERPDAPVRTPEQIEADWRRQEEVRTPNAPPSTPVVIQRGRKLAARLNDLGVDTQPYVDRLEEIAKADLSLSKDAANSRGGDLKTRARWVVRELALKNPLLADFDDLVFVKRAAGSHAHMSDQYYGWWSRPGGGLFILEDFKSDEPRLKNLTGSLPSGSVLRPDLSFDGEKILFAYCRHHEGLAGEPNKVDKSNVPEDAFYHLYEINIDGTGLKRLTRGKYDDFDARYLPSGEIVFLSTRRGRLVQAIDGTTADGVDAAPDSYVRCAGDDSRPVAIYTLHVLDSDRKRIRAISPFENFEWTPSVADDGRILYARWDYVDRSNQPFMSLWSTLPDGTNAVAVYGNYTFNPLSIFEARTIPGSRKMVFTASAHHSITGGSLVLLDPEKTPDGRLALKRLTPEVPFPESERWPTTYFANPLPLADDFHLLAWSDKPLVPEWDSRREPNAANATGIYLLDGFGNLELIYRDPEISSATPLPLRPRQRGVVLAPQVGAEARAPSREAQMLLLNVYDGLEDAPAGSIRGLRLIGIPPKTQPHQNRPPLGITGDDPGKFVMGTVPVDRDGSANFHAPAGVTFFMQALDKQGMAVQTMRSAVYLQSGQQSTCIGCHEPRNTAPANVMASAAMRPPSKITPPPDGAWPLSYKQLVQPVLEKHCVECHSPSGEASAVDLTSGFSYGTLITVGRDRSLHGHVQTRYDQGYSVAGKCGAAVSPVTELLQEGHHDVKLSDDDWRRLFIWMDTYAQRAGYFSKQQRLELEELRGRMRPILVDQQD
jgi:hypothetical protein